MRIVDVLCLACGFVHASTRPNEAALLAYYRDAHTRCSDYVDVRPDYDLPGRLRRIDRFIPRGARILELGAGTGEFCAALRQSGWDATPVDPLGDEHITASGKRFNAVLAYLVLEHVHDPNQFIHEAANRLESEGVLIVEVPDFPRDPVNSLVPEHLWHYAPAHLAALFADCGLSTLEVDRSEASRPFAFAITARLTGSPARPEFRSGHVEMMRAAYLRAAPLINAEEARIHMLTDFIAAAHPPRVYVWGANEYASRIGRHFAESRGIDVRVVDSAASKIGTFHEGFSRPIEPPEFSGNEPERCVVLLCSPTWNAQIRQQVEASRLRTPKVLDAIEWRPRHLCK